MANITSLSSEILLNIFTKLDKASQAGECRLVCKSWSSLAEMAMLQDVKLYQDEKMMKLFAVLVRTPSKARFIKHINVCFDEEMELWHKETLLLAITPNLESIVGTIESDKSYFYKHVLDIVRNSAVKFDKMKRLGVYDEYKSDSIHEYVSLCLQFQDTLQDLEISVDEFPVCVDGHLDKLSQLKNLSALSLVTDLLEFYEDDLEAFLNHVSPVKTLSIYTTVVLREQEDLSFQRCESMVKRLDQLRVLKVKVHQCSANFIRYLVYKYINLHQLELEFEVEDYQDLNHLVVENLEDILEALRAVPKKKFTLAFSTSDFDGRIVAYLIERGYNLEVGKKTYHEYYYRIEIEIKNI